MCGIAERRGKYEMSSKFVNAVKMVENSHCITDDNNNNNRDMLNLLFCDVAFSFVMLLFLLILDEFSDDKFKTL